MKKSGNEAEKNQCFKYFVLTFLPPSRFHISFSLSFFNPFRSTLGYFVSLFLIKTFLLLSVGMESLKKVKDVIALNMMMNAIRAVIFKLFR